MKKLIAVAAVCATVLGGALAASAQDPSPAFEKLKTLAGDWEVKLPDGKTALVNYRVTSGGSVVMETTNPGEPGEMVTLFHRDGPTLMATHYCAAKNQPRMRASGLSADGKEIAFKFLDITNLASPEATHMREVTFQFLDDDHVTTVWTAREKGQDAPWTFALTRKK
ncbi:MAG: hypothetical protein ACE145_21625 [Terriglobia bacterium]